MSKKLSLYIHWPFCQAKCPYCDFNSHVRHDPVDQQRFARALVSELGFFAEHTRGRPIETIFFGGGTPSLMQPAAVECVLQEIAKLWPLSEAAEITLEANPSSAEAANFRGYRAAGVNRLSLGVQALNDEDLERLGRLHNSAEAVAAFELAKAVFPQSSFDLIYARPNQSLEDWHAELSRALSFEPDHMSLYQLTIEPGTPYAALHAAGKLATPGEDHAASLYELTQELTGAAGLQRYEISNHARDGHQCRHNLTYWGYGDFAGIGPGAYSRLTSNGLRQAWKASRDPDRWLKQVEAHGHAQILEETLKDTQQAEEYLLMGLRRKIGISKTRFAQLAGRELPADALAQLQQAGLLYTPEPSRIAATPTGFLVLNRVIAELL